MNKLTLALIIALSSSYATASDATTWGGDLDGHFKQTSIDTMDTTAHSSGPVDSEAAYSGLDGDIDKHVFASDKPSSVQREMVDPTDAYADLDGDSDFAGGV